MCVFKQIKTIPDENFCYIPEILKCFNKFSKFLHDDFTKNDGVAYITNALPYLWTICDVKNHFMGFVILDNFTGNYNQKFSAEISVCFHPKAWGSYTRYCAKIFLKKCFDEFGLYKIKAQIFPDNYRVKRLLKSAGFKPEAIIPNETVRNGKVQNIEMYAIYRNYYYKNEEI